jgi:hypothetical protein
MSRVLAPLFFIEERALSIGFWFKGASERQIGVPELHGFAETLFGSQAIPFRPFFTHEFFCAYGFHDL